MKIKNYTLIILLFSAFSSKAQISIPNAGFENWTTATSTTVAKPVSWTDNASTLLPAMAAKSTDAHGGNYAVKMSVVKFGAAHLAGTMYIKYTFPAATAATFGVWMKIHLDSTDEAFVNPILLKNGTSTVASSNSVYLTSANNSSVWTQVTMPMTVSNPIIPDSAYIGFGYVITNDTSSYILIDDVAFDPIPAGITEADNDVSIEQTYPNPVSDLETIMYSLNNAAVVSLNVYDLLGNKISEVINGHQNAGRYRAEIDASGFSNGIYLAVLTVNGKVHTRKIIVQH